MTAPLVALEDVVRRYDGEAGGQTVLDGLSWTVAAGDAVAVVGASGSGKTTLLNLMGALDRPTSGVVRFEGTSLAALDDDALAALRADRIGFVFQDHHLLPQCTALENVLVPTLARRSRASREAAQRAKGLLARVGLADHVHKPPHELSGGQRQRVAVVRALVNEPALLLADEPTGSLDRASSDTLVDLLLELNRESGTALVVVTHADEVARRVGTVLALTDGRLAAADLEACTTPG